MAVREPDGYHGKVQETMWGTWPTFESWNWHGWEGQPIEVEVVSTLPEVVLQLDGQEIGRKKVGRDTEYKAVFRIEYHPGRLVAIGYDASGNAYKSNEIATAGAPAEIRHYSYSRAQQPDRPHLKYPQSRPSALPAPERLDCPD